MSTRPHEESTDAPGLQVENVSHSYGPTSILRDISLTVRAGEIHCLLGPSGSGKSTLLRLVAGLESVQDGKISMSGSEVGSLHRHVLPEQRRIGFVFQDYALFPHLTVEDNLCFGITGGSKSAKRTRASALLHSVGLPGFEKKMPNTLSGGEQQRVALARALARDPAVMLLDEPFSGLDARLRDEVRRTTLDVLKASSVATLLVTHDPREAMLIADTISILRPETGRIEQSGSPRALYTQPISAFAALSLGEACCFSGPVRDGGVDTPFGVLAPSIHDSDGTGTVVLRPECFAFVDSTAPGAASATVASVHHLGATTRVEVELPTDGPVVIISPERVSFERGQLVFVAITDAARESRVDL
ncbi:MAG: ABC transporter ATP-binding protein [Planctomycetota bacterium]